MTSQKELCDRAKLFAIRAHTRINQLQRYPLDSYDAHLRDVVDLVASVTDDVEMISAAWLHDVVEDTQTTVEEIEFEFGYGVSSLVAELTDVSRPSDGNRWQRKAIDRKQAALVSPRAKTIRLADLIDNARDIPRHNLRLAQKYLSELEALLDVLHGGASTLFDLATQTLELCRLQLRPVFLESRPGKNTSEVGTFLKQRGTRLFTQAFTAIDIMEPLMSFDRTALSLTVDPLHSPIKMPWEVIGVREDGRISGYLYRGALSDANELTVKPFSEHQIVAVDTPMVDIVHILTHFSCCFVSLDGGTTSIIGVIGKTDIEKPVVRMWLFGMIILIEMVVVEHIRNIWPDSGWTPLVSEGRLERAKQLQQERQRRNVNNDLLDCLQFADKMQIICNSPDFLESSGFASIKSARKAFRDFEMLRNDLAHGQEVSSRNWPSIVRLARRIYELLEK